MIYCSCNPNGRNQASKIIRIIDGRNRYRACLEAGVEPHFRTWEGEGSLTAYVLSLNLHRRHLDTSQLGMCAARALPFYEEEAKARQLSTLKQNTDSQNFDYRECGKATEHAARDFNVSHQTVASAKKVLCEGTNELIDAVEAVERGSVAVAIAQFSR